MSFSNIVNNDTNDGYVWYVETGLRIQKKQIIEGRYEKSYHKSP